MGEETKSFEAETDNIETLSHNRIFVLMGVITVLISIYGFLYLSWSFGVGVILGGIGSFINYFWLKHSISEVFQQAEEGESPRFSATTSILRYFIFALILLVVYLTEIIPLIAVVLGLASFAFAIVIEGFIRIFESLNNNRKLK